MDMREYALSLNETRLRVWNEAQQHLDDCTRLHPQDGMNVEEQEKWDRFMTRIDELDAERSKFIDRETREREAAVGREAFERQYGTDGAQRATQSEADEVRAWAAGHSGGKELSVNIGAAMNEANLIRQGADAKELRALLWDTGTSGTLVPTILSRNLYQYMEASIAALRMPTTKITTNSGEPLDFPKVLAHGIATQVIAQGTAIGGTDPTFSKVTLNAYKYGQLVPVASEVLQDSGVDILGFISANIGRAIGRLVDTHLIAGTGTGQPQGMMAAGTGSAGTVATGGSLITPTYENLVDVVYSVVDEYRNGGNAAWLMKDATAGNLRKLRDGAGGTVGAVLWNPSLTSGIQFGQPDRLLDYPVYTDPNVASLASNNRILAFGDWNAYYVRLVGNVVIERSDDYAFNVDEATFRGKIRLDGKFLDTTATNILKMSV